MNFACKTALLTALAAGICLTLLPAAGAEKVDPTAATIKLKKGDRVLFFGDSLTALALGPKGYVSLVRKALKEKHPELGIEVLAVATGGHRVTDLIKRVDKDVIARKPTVVFIQIGVNDAAGGVTPEQFKLQIEELIGKLQKAGARVVLCSLTSLGEKRDGANHIDKKLEALADVARTVAREQKVPLNDLRKAFVDYWKKHNPDNKDKGILTYDGNHFNDTGHRFVAGEMLKKLK
jgi:lysophospholipase L1-like esterase